MSRRGSEIRKKDFNGMGGFSTEEAWAQYVADRVMQQVDKAAADSFYEVRECREDNYHGIIDVETGRDLSLCPMALTLIEMICEKRGWKVILTGDSHLTLT